MEREERESFRPCRRIFARADGSAAGSNSFCFNAPGPGSAIAQSEPGTARHLDLRINMLAEETVTTIVNPKSELPEE
jgi:hypothetical protein